MMNKKMMALWMSIGMLLSVAGCSGYRQTIDEWMAAGMPASSAATENANAAMLAAPSPSESLYPWETPRPEPRYTMVFYQSLNDTLWQKAYTNDVQAASAQANIELIYGEASNSQPVQVAMLEKITAYQASHADAKDKIAVIAFTPVVDAGWNDALAQLKKANIPVVVLGRPIQAPKELYAVSIHADWRAQGEDAADWLLAALPDPNAEQHIVTLQNAEEKSIDDAGNTGISAQIQAGFETTMAQHSNWKMDATIDVVDSRIEAKKAMIRLLAPEYNYKKQKEKPPVESFTPVDIIFAHTDHIAIGAAEAVREMGLTPGEDVFIVSVGGGRAALSAIMDGSLSASVENNPQMGDILVAVADQLAQGQAWGEQEVLLRGEVFDQSNAAHFYSSRLY